MEAVESILIGDRCEILVSEKLPSPLLPVRAGHPPSRVVVLTQPGPVAGMAGAVVDRIVQDGAEGQGPSVEVHTIGIPDRDQAKTLAVTREVYRELDRLRVDRYDAIVGVGGGAATDLTGFVASTWLRGVEVVYVPTTLLGAVDASIGGKTGVNRQGKNQIGTFRHPRRVIVAIEFLEALPRGLLIEGMAETLKAGLIGDPRLAEILERHGLASPLPEVISRAVRVKAEVVATDFFETGRRAILNYGHTIGHAVEAATGMPHGHAVAIGMVAAGAVSSEKLGYPHQERQKQMIGSLGLPLASPPIDRSTIMELLGRDKKRRGGALPRMVLLEDIGRPVVVEVSQQDLEVGLAAIKL